MNIYEVFNYLINSNFFTGREKTMALIKLCNYLTLDYIKYLSTEKYHTSLKDGFERWYEEEGEEEYEMWESFKENSEVDA